MATGRKKPEDGGLVGRLAERGEEAVNRLANELSNNPMVTDALGKALSAKGKVDAGARRTLSQIGLAASDELKDLRKQIERLERRLARLEGGSTAKRRSSTGTSAKRTETKKPTARKKTTTVKGDAKKAASPASGRSLGGGTGRGSSAGGGSAAA
jgi:polyhydroxyalkanoate synthesis regulator phasin